VIIFQHKDKKIPKKLTVDQSINKILALAKNFFRFADEDQFYLSFNNKEINEDLLLSDLNFEDQTVLDLVQRTLPPSDLVTFQIFIDTKGLLPWQGPSSIPILEALKTFCNSNELDLSSFEPSLDGTPIPEDMLLGDIPNPVDDIIHLDPKSKDANQETPKREEKTEEIQIKFILSETESYTFLVTWEDSVKSLKLALAERASFPSDFFQMWSVQGRELDYEKPLSSQLNGESFIINVKLLKYATLKINSKGRQSELLVPIYPIYTIEQLKIKFEKEIRISSHNQHWHFYGSNDSLPDYAKLSGYLDNPEDPKLTIFIKDTSDTLSSQAKGKLKERKVFIFQYKGEDIRKYLSLDEDLSAVYQTIFKSIKRSDEDAPFILKFKEKTMDLTKRLSDYMSEPTGPIQIEDLQNEENLMNLVVFFQKDDLVLSVNRNQKVQEIKNLACPHFKALPSQLYSIFLEKDLLASTVILKDIPEFSEDSVFDLFQKIPISLVVPKSGQVQQIIFDPTLTVEELKKQISSKKFMKSQEFNLFIGEKELEEMSVLSNYLQNDDPVVITLLEKEEKEVKIEILFNKLPENIQYLKSILKSESFQDLTELLSKEFNLDKLTQVWRNKDEFLLEQSDWEAFLTKYDGKENLVIDIFECRRPLDQKILITVHQRDTSISQTLQLNLLTSMRKLKQEVAKTLVFSENCNQIWKIESQELSDDLPFAIHYNLIKEKGLEGFDIYLSNKKELTLCIEDKLLPVLLDLDVPILTLKEALFKENKVNITPTLQFWSLETDVPQRLEDDKTLVFYLKGNDKIRISVTKKVFLLKITFNDLEVNSIKSFDDIEVDPTLTVGALKKDLKPKLDIDPSKQYWIHGQTELKDEFCLTDSLTKDGDSSFNVEVLKLKEFIVFDGENRFPFQLPLNLKVVDLKKRIQEKNLQGVEVERMILEARGKKLEDSREIHEYLIDWIEQDRPSIVIKKKAMLEIHFLNKIHKIYFDHETTVPILENEIKEKFSFGDHTFRLHDKEKEILEKDLKEILKMNSDKVLLCQKVKEFTLIFEDLQDAEKAIIKIDALKSISFLAVKVSKKLGVSIDECIILYKGHPCQKTDEMLLDHLNPECSKIELKIQTVKVLEVRKLEQIYTTNYLPSETIADIKNKLISVGFSDAEKFTLAYDKSLLKDEQSLELSGIRYGKHTLDAISKKKISILIRGEEHSETCGGKLKLVADLKRHIQESLKLDIGKQLLLLMNKDQWQRTLSQDNEVLEEIETENQDQITVLCKPIKRFSIKLASHLAPETFEGLAGACLEDQKKLLEITYKIPADQQVWVIGQNKKMRLINEEEFSNNLAEDNYKDSNPIQIFRKINLAVCLNGKSYVLSNLSTHETILAQKAKINDILNILPQNQQWHYEQKQLDDSKSLEECFNTTREDNQGKSQYALDLIVQKDLEYFGFTKRSEIRKDAFHKFYIESDEELDLIIKGIRFGVEEEGLLFRNKLLGLFFSTLKKHSLWENLISKIKHKIYKEQNINIWQSNEKNRTKQSHFNTQFLLYYFLNSGTSELNIEILRIMKMHFPVPLVINTWTNRFTIEETKVLDDLYWVLQKGFIVTSFGVGQAASQVCGKTELNNRLLQSNFVRSTERNQICKGCPEIIFDIYKNDKFPINFVDIPSGTSEEIKKKIIESSNMLIIHSLADDDEKMAQEFIKSQIQKIPKIVIYRDYPNAFSNVSSFRENLMKSYAEGLKTNIFEVKVDENPDYLESNELNDISETINEYILQSFQNVDKDQELWKFSHLFEKSDHSIHDAFDKIRENSSQLVKAIPVFNELKTIERTNMAESQKENETKALVAKFREKSLAPEMTRILAILSSLDSLSTNKFLEKPAIILEKLQEYLRMMKSQQTMDFYKLYEYKTSFSECTAEDEKMIIENFLKYWNKVGKQDRHFKDQNPSSSRKEDICPFIEKCIQTFELQIIPNIFSIELFWRELIYFNSLRPGCQIKIQQKSDNQSPEKNNTSGINLNDFLVNLKKENLLNAYPFEIIDGDLLYMPKEFFKTVFKGMNDRVIVVSVLGPQSSGKSTLLNFLFGCNFVTSSGRCTKGIYGTYFKVSNSPSCDGILVLDTEGLFGLLNKKEKQQRDKFDKKLVLFCLAMSDFVLINFKGDIDQTLTDVLMVCQDSLKRLQQGNEKVPEMFLILNQNTQTDLNTQLKDIDSMGEYGYVRRNVEVLPLAFETSINQSPTIAKFMEPGTKKIPKMDFSDKCRKLSLKLFEKISKKIESGKQRTLEKIIDRMEHLWELLDKYPDLVKHDRLLDQKRESEIKDWIQKQVDVTFTNKIARIVENIKRDPKKKQNWEKEFSEKYNEELDETKRVFCDEYKKDTQGHLFKELENILDAHLEGIRIQKMGELKFQTHQEKMKVYDAQGNETIRAAAYKIRNSPNITEDQQDLIFEETWNVLLSKLQNFFDKAKESERLFNTVVENYRVNINKSTKALPALRFPYDQNFTSDDYKLELKRQILKEYVEDKCFETTSDPPALIFKGGKTNISGKYFNLKNFFTETDVEETFGIPREKLYQMFDFRKIREVLLKDPDATKKENYVINKIMNQLTRELANCGVTIPRPLLERTLKFKTNFWKWKHFSHDYVKEKEYLDYPCEVNFSQNCYNEMEYVNGGNTLQTKIGSKAKKIKN